jgi:pimeloyl-CoA synthetase
MKKATAIEKDLPGKEIPSLLEKIAGKEMFRSGVNELISDNLEEWCNAVKYDEDRGKAMAVLFCMRAISRHAELKSELKISSVDDFIKGFVAGSLLVDRTLEQNELVRILKTFESTKK